MKTQEVKEVLDSYYLGAKWKRLKKYKRDGNVMRDFKNSTHLQDHVFEVNTGPNDERVVSFTIVRPEPMDIPEEPEIKVPKGKGYFYKLYSESDEFMEIEYPVTHVLTIGSKQRWMDDGPYDAQKALDPMMQKSIGVDPLDRELMEGTFELMDGEAAKLEILLLAAGWQQGGW